MSMGGTFEIEGLQGPRLCASEGTGSPRLPERGGKDVKCTTTGSLSLTPCESRHCASPAVRLLLTVSDETIHRRSSSTLAANVRAGRRVAVHNRPKPDRPERLFGQRVRPRGRRLRPTGGRARTGD